MPILISGDQVPGACLGPALLCRLGRVNRLFQHLLIKLDADFLDVARLLGAQKISRAANIKVVAGQAETGAQTVQALHDFEPAFGRAVELFAGRQSQIGIGARFGPADAAPELIELRQAEHVGAVDNHGVDIRDVEARFNDRR